MSDKQAEWKKGKLQIERKCSKGQWQKMPAKCIFKPLLQLAISETCFEYQRIILPLNSQPFVFFSSSHKFKYLGKFYHFIREKLGQNFHKCLGSAWLLNRRFLRVPWGKWSKNVSFSSNLQTGRGGCFVYKTTSRSVGPFTPVFVSVAIAMARW